ncbi:hypothetical protein GCM10010448_44410 [Streptomyces glomeratus]|uniref:Transposase IS200-like domain-containing protein n=1 Tax=Streptomyces glomeratus TaxID=284452 RepID=A0ABP6LSP4_9ACTN
MFWSPSYFAASCGGAPLSIVKDYIENQKRPTDRHHASAEASGAARLRAEDRTPARPEGRDSLRRTRDGTCGDGFTLAVTLPYAPPRRTPARRNDACGHRRKRAVKWRSLPSRSLTLTAHGLLRPWNDK